jgi:proline iminopeptidase
MMNSFLKSGFNGLVPFVISVVFSLSSCVGNKDSESSSIAAGEFFLEVPGGKIWYKVTGSGHGLPVVLLHGGPGGSSYYLKAFEDLGNERIVIRYDQLGAGKSDVVTDTGLFTVEHFVKELDLLRSHLGISKWHVFGHSWGTILAIEYYKMNPENVSSLTFSSLCFDIPAWERSTKQLLETLPDSLKNAIHVAEEIGNFDNPLYQEAMNQVYAKYVWGPNFDLPDFDSLMSTFNANLYGYMWGPSEFTITGTLEDYSATSVLPSITIPTLFTVGEFDEISPDIVKEYAGMVRNSQFNVFAGSSHMTPWDARDESVSILSEFLNSVDSSKDD